MGKSVIKKTRGITRKDQAQKILSEVPQINAFYFFEDSDKDCGISARSLNVFSNKLTTIDKKSLDFHFKRGDFENWIRSTIGDSFLANEIAKINESFEEEQLLEQVCKIINERLKELKQLLALEEPYIEHDDDLQ
jgi:hypothetical protein